MTNIRGQYTFSYQFENTGYVKANKVAETASIAIHGYFIGTGEKGKTETTINGNGTLTIDYVGDKSLDEALERICLAFASYYVPKEEEVE